MPLSLQTGTCTLLFPHSEWALKFENTLSTASATNKTVWCCSNKRVPDSDATFFGHEWRVLLSRPLGTRLVGQCARQGAVLEGLVAPQLAACRISGKADQPLPHFFFNVKAMAQVNLNRKSIRCWLLSELEQSSQNHSVCLNVRLTPIQL